MRFADDEHVLNLSTIAHQGNARYLVVLTRERDRTEQEPIKEYYYIDLKVDCNSDGSVCQFVSPTKNDPIKIKMKNEPMGHGY
ncbi:MAG: hypothetical protein PUP46_09120 [Endozoicomonas sp. (ex Botrylloides leachii)]|nr:hypothetical protein [Endozoicomonas sp. (ex Botrylloides leachii)]